MAEAALEPKLKRNPLLITLLIVAVAAALFIGFALVWTDWLWFKTLNLGIVFTTQLAAQIGLFLGFGLVMAGLLAGSMLTALRLRPKIRQGNAESAVFVQFRNMIDNRRAFLVAGPSAAAGVLAGLSAVASSDTFLAWLNMTSFGKTDPYFGLDVSFYVFSYPWWRVVISFLLLSLGASLLVTIFMHFMTGAISSGSLRKTAVRNRHRGAHTHISIMAGLLMAVYGVKLIFDRLGLSVHEGTHFTGVHYTDAQARMSALFIMAMISFLCAGLFFANAVLRRWNIPLTALVLMIVTGLIIGTGYPWWVQTFDVKPNEQDKEVPYIANNLVATQAAFGIDHLEIEDYNAVATVSAGQLRADAGALPSIRLMDPAIIGQTFEQLQQVRGYYIFPNKLDVDRYHVKGKDTDAVVAARELDLKGTSDNNWNNTHTVYTHGFGLVAAYGNRRESNGEPQFLLGGIPTVGELPEHEPRIYFGEQAGHYVIVGAPEGATPVELDTPGGANGRTETHSTFNGTTGVPIGGFFNRLLFSMKFTDLNLLLTDRVNSESVILFDRTPRERIQKVAPWLKVDSDVYPTIVDGRIKWVVDAYTTSSTYPNSKTVDWSAKISDTQDPPAGGLSDKVNYVRNSVKATVDAYDGTVTLYAWDEADPILQTWQKVYPGVVKPRSEISEDLLKHLRYPQDLFKVQREVLSQYHTKSAATWFQKSDIWQVPADPTKGSEKEQPTGTATKSADPKQPKESPYYLTIKWPGEEKPAFSQTSVFVPLQRHNLSVFMAVNSDASSKDYGRMRMLKLSDSQQIAGPTQVFNAIATDGKVAEKLLPFTKQGNTSTIFGNLLTLPVGGGLLYVQPIYTKVNQADGATGAYPALRFVAVRFGEHVGIGSTLQQALDEVFQGDSGAKTGENLVEPPNPGTGTTPPPNPGTTPPPNPGTPTPAPGTVTPPAATGNAAAQALLGEAAKLFDEADAALKAGDLAGYQSKLKEAKQKVEAAMKALG